RLDDLVVFHPLGTDQLQRIARIQLDHLQRRLDGRRLTLDVTADALVWLAENGNEPAYGARPLRRLIQTAVGDSLARAILARQIGEGDTVHLDSQGGELLLRADAFRSSSAGLRAPDSEERGKP
ncbi:hypothetical protein ACIQU6_41440, partial [Streptomyces sp. NPDC090442]